jgi:phosphoglycolate phosphatase
VTRAVYVDLDGTLLGPGACLVRGGDGGFSDAGVRALALLHDARVPLVLVSGRSAPRLETAARILGADGWLPEMGATDAGYPTAPGQSVHAAIAASGVPAELLAREPGLAVHTVADVGREGSHVLRGRAGADAAAWVRARSGGTLRLADNGRIGLTDDHVFHILPAGASKAAAVARDLARRGADPARCLAVGDSGQDLDMGRAVGAVAIVANGAAADPDVAARAPWVTRGSFGEGVLEAVAAWLAGAGVPGPPPA